MAVPAHDERDFEFAHKYGLPIKPVIRPAEGELSLPLTAAYTEPGILFDSGEFDGLDFEGAFIRMEAVLKAKGLGQVPHPVSSARLGHFAPTLLGLPDPRHLLLAVRRRTGARCAVASRAAA